MREAERARRAAAGLALALAVGGGQAGRAEAAARPAGGDCGPYRLGVGGVIQIFCSGSARLKLKVGDKHYVMKGGQCSISSAVSAFNIGVVSAPGARPRPDYVGLSTSRPRHFRGAILAVTVEGRTLIAPKNAGKFGKSGGAFTATALGGQPIRGVFTC